MPDSIRRWSQDRCRSRNKAAAAFAVALEYGEQFRHKATARLSYTVDRFSISWQTTYLSKMTDYAPGEFDPDGRDPEIAAHNKISDRFYHNVQLRYDVNKQYRFYVNVDNLFDRKPPVLEDVAFPYGNITGTTTAADVYDPFGRRFYVGVQVRF